MSFDPYTPVTTLTESINRKEISPVEVLRAFLDRIERFNPELNAFVTLDTERAMAEAKAAETRLQAGEELGPLGGLPFGVKDLEDVGGMLTTYGSQLFKENIAASDSVNVARLRAAGAYPIGKTNTPEFGAYMQSSNSVFGATRNPWNLERTPGGSSGGSASALVGGLVPIATASDGGGSIRHPAAFSGCVGLKPTFRRVPVLPSPMLTFDDTGVWGPLTLTVRDAARIADVTFGAHEDDPMALPDLSVGYEATLQDSPGSLRVGYYQNPELFVQPDVAREVDASAKVLEQLGHSVEIFDEPMPFAGKAWSLISAVSTFMKYSHGVDESTMDQLDPMLRGEFERVQRNAASDLTYSYRRRTELVRWAASAFERFDVLAMPTLPLEAFPIGIAHPVEIAGRPVRVHDAFPFTYPFNLTGHPALSLPAGMTDNGLPAAIELVGRRFSEDILLRLGRQFEEARPWSIAPKQYRG